MKKMYFNLSLTLITVVALITACSVQKITRTEKTYEEVHKKDAEPYTVSYDLPIISPTNDSKQTQTKDGVTITCEIVPFNVSMHDEVNKEIWYADPNKQGYDFFQISHTPKPEIYPKQFELNIKIKNNQERILKVRETALLLQIDGVTYHIPEASLQDWYAGMIIKNGEFNYKVQGPEFNSLINAKLVYLFINDVPTIMDEGGNIKKRDNFEWYFECKKQTIQKQEQKTYTYETSLIETKRCDKCSGTGTDPQAYKCSSCNGTGQFKGYDGKIYKCSKCNGTGIVHYQCGNCGGKGVLSFPKSQLPKVTNSITWNGWQVQVNSIPSGATIKGISTKTGQYDSYPCTTPCKINWYCTSGKSCPIIVEYNGQIVKVMPYKTDGKESGTIAVDFTSGTPIVTKGQKVD